MKISPNWLRDFVDIKVDEQELARDITMAGLAVEGFSGEGRDTVYEVEFTTNRVDAMNHFGVAREISAIYDTDLRPLAPRVAAANSQTPNFPIVIEDAKGCARYTARIIRGVKIGPSPEMVAKRLESVEQRSISNVADATNYTLWEMGHPTHAFDLDLLEGGTIIIRRARAGETLVTLDGVERKLSTEDLVIADAAKPVALAGVMGGLHSSITEKTTNVLIESAWFDPSTIRKTARRHAMHTDASHRFERGADFGATQLACARVAELILQSAGGQLEGGEIDVVAREIKRPEVTLRRTEVTRHLGKDIADVEITRILRRLGFGMTAGRTTVASHVTAHTVGVGGAHAAVAEEPADYSVKVPTWRLDVDREIDLIEEIARVHGYNNFPNTLPSFAGAVVEKAETLVDAKLRTTLLALGYNEALSLTFIAREDATRFSSMQPVGIANPLSEEAATMRTSLVPGVLDMLARNLNYGTTDARLFEMGHVYEKFGDRTHEWPRLTIGATGAADLGNVHSGKARAYSFFDMKGDIETVLEAFEQRAIYFDANTPDYYHPGRSARVVVDGATVAQFGQLHSEVATERKLKQDVFLAEFFLDRLHSRKLREVRYAKIPRFPAVDRDFSFVFDDAVTFERIRLAVEQLRIAEMRRFAPVETFRGGTVPKGKYSLLVRAEFQSAERTLRDEEVAAWASQIITALEKLGGTLRG